MCLHGRLALPHTPTPMGQSSISTRDCSNTGMKGKVLKLLSVTDKTKGPITWKALMGKKQCIGVPLFFSFFFFLLRAIVVSCVLFTVPGFLWVEHLWNIYYPKCRQILEPMDDRTNLTCFGSQEKITFPGWLPSWLIVLSLMLRLGA